MYSEYSSLSKLTKAMGEMFTSNNITAMLSTPVKNVVNIKPIFSIIVSQKISF